MRYKILRVQSDNMFQTINSLIIDVLFFNRGVHALGILVQDDSVCDAKHVFIMSKGFHELLQFHSVLIHHIQKDSFQSPRAFTKFISK